MIPALKRAAAVGAPIILGLALAAGASGIALAQSIGGGGGGAAAGATTQLQQNNGGVLAGAPLYAPSANIVEQRNGTTAQSFRIYNTYTDASNYERGVCDWVTVANQFTCGAQNAGTGVAHNFGLVAGTQSFLIGSNGAITWSGALNIATGQFFGWTGRSKIQDAGDGVLQFSNNAVTSFTRLRFGGSTSSFMGLGFSGSTMALVAADGTAPTYASCTALTTNSSGVIGCTASDPRLKVIEKKPFAPGIRAVMGVVSGQGPIVFKGKPGNPENVDTRRQAGFNCAVVAAHIPLGYHYDKQGYCNLDPEALIATLFNAVSDLQSEITALKRHGG